MTGWHLSMATEDDRRSENATTITTEPQATFDRDAARHRRTNLVYTVMRALQETMDM
jgi:hypothetical protein